MEILLSSAYTLPSLVLGFGFVMFLLGFAAGRTKAERRNKVYRRVWGM